MKKRTRIKGKICGLCSTYIAKLAGVAPVTVRRWIKHKKGNVSYSDLRVFIFEAEAKNIMEDIRKATAIDFSDRISSLLQREKVQ